MTETSTPARTNAWRAFWDRGGWWKALGFVVVYLAAYQFLPLLAAPVLRGAIDQDDVFATPESVFVAITFSLLVGSVLLIVFALTVRWLPKPLFGRQPVRGRWWMWLAVVLVLIPIVLRALGTDYSRYSVGVILMVFLSAAFVGFSEELLTRGVVVVLLRRGGYNEWVVAALCALLFSALHSANFFTGQEVATVGFTLAYTFCFGIMMYLIMRVTGTIIWAMVLHGLTDPTTMLASGGVDELNSGTTNVFITLVSPATVLMMIGALVLLIFIRGNARGRAAMGEPERVATPTSG
ncbi:CPBP family intramembrane glutamic endopeptidase [Agromyces kandeliae]|uniref:CPBP family intramembrane metalloprotease n=1 Tax=Agromyces kandeliae TaxID=2666141 RepID=A0A6L5R4C1_9MICO|nr:CPBP family intramembrane glutamic endopeptidase [Agromyces kandeliae]MRX44790.1 CPBP family intramembrane metalloprotease [Agromyces kandeliae]